MDVNHHYIKTTKTARYASYGQLSAKTKYFWFALHGSKMTSEQIAYKFTDLDPEEHFIIAPEGLSRFYLKGFGGEVVATWMTKRDRLQEIEDFSNYLGKLYSSYAGKLPADCKKISLGFSQGGTTLYRWLHSQKVSIDHLIAYSCWIPEDIDLGKSATPTNSYKGIYTYGLQDQFLTTERIAALDQVIKNNNIEMVREPYEGDHRVNRNQLKFLFEKYIQV